MREAFPRWVLAQTGQRDLEASVALLLLLLLLSVGGAL